MNKLIEEYELKIKKLISEYDTKLKVLFFDKKKIKKLKKLFF